MLYSFWSAPSFHTLCYISQPKQPETRMHKSNLITCAEACREISSDLKSMETISAGISSGHVKLNSIYNSYFNICIYEQ